jgi:protein involved in polysaccharide export with SLBB domain
MHKLLLAISVLFSSVHYSQGVVAQMTAKPASTNTASDAIGNARKFYQLGLDLMEAGQLSQAAGNFRQALQLDPEYAEAYAALGRTYFKMREWQQASDNLKRAVVLNHKQRNAAGKVASVPQIAETVQFEPVQPDIVVATHAPLNISLRRINAEIVSPNETTAATINLRKLLPLLPEPPPEIKPVVSETSAPNPIPAVRTDLTKIYRVGPNDVLDIRLNDPSGQQSTLYTVTAAGLLLSEPMSVAGLTVEEISSRIEADLQRRAIIEEAKAVVGVRDYASHTVLVSGLVKDSGTKVLRREAIPLYVVVADAQPLPEAAKVTVVRGSDSNQIYNIDLNQPADMNLLVRSGDVITVHPGPVQFIYIAGEIKSPGEKTFRRGLTLMQVILASGGVGPKAKVAEIARSNDKGFLVPTRFNLKEIETGKTADPVVKPGDRISILR